MIPRAKAMSVAAGIAHPRNVSEFPQFMAAKIIAGNMRPPKAAIAGRLICDLLESWPSMTSRLISKVTSRKKIAISPSLIQ